MPDPLAASGTGAAHDCGDAGNCPIHDALTPATAPDAECIAQQFHRVYEALAPTEGYRTRDESAVPWEDVPEVNRRLMVRTVEVLIVAGVISRGDGANRRFD